MIKNDAELSNPTLDPSGDAPTRVFEVIEKGKVRLAAVEYSYGSHEPRSVMISGNGRRRSSERAIISTNDNMYDESEAFIEARIDVMETLLYSRQNEITDSDTDHCGNPDYVRLISRIEAGMYDLQYIMSVMKKINDEGDLIISLKSYKEAEDIMDSNIAEFAIDESQMTLMEFKEFFVNEGTNDCHIFIQTLDYAQFQGLRDRKTPSPSRN